MNFFTKFTRNMMKKFPFLSRRMETARMLGLVEMLEKTRKDELSCDEVLEVIDEYAERALKGEDPSHLMPLVRQHLEMCPECREEYEALLQILEASAQIV